MRFLGMRVARIASDRVRVVVARGTGGRWRWSLRRGTATVAVGPVAGHVAPADASAHWREVARDIAADPRTPIEIEE